MGRLATRCARCPEDKLQLSAGPFSAEMEGSSVIPCVYPRCVWPAFAENLLQARGRYRSASVGPERGNRVFRVGEGGGVGEGGSRSRLAARWRDGVGDVKAGGGPPLRVGSFWYGLGLCARRV